MKALAIMGVPMLLILSQPDLGTASVYIPIFLAMCFMAGETSLASAAGKCGLVPLARLERARLATNDFESFASTIPPQGHSCAAALDAVRFLFNRP